MASEHNHAPWRKSFLVPFWTVQQLLLIFFIGALAFAIGVLTSWAEDQADITLPDDPLYHLLHINAPMWLAFCSACLLLTITEIVLLATHHLKPLVFVIINGIKSAAWTVVLILHIVPLVKAKGRGISLIVTVIEAILLLSFCIPLIYGIILWRRPRNDEVTYAPVYTSDSNPGSTTSYPSQYKNIVVEETVAVESSHPDPARERRLSYNHNRDTRFESSRHGIRSLSNPDGMGMGSEVIVTGNGNMPGVRVGDHDLEVLNADGSRNIVRQMR